MPSFLNPHKLHPNPANTIFDPLPPEVYEALKEDIAEHGIHDALLVTPDFTIIAGHHRVRAALELGLDTVPVEIQDVNTDEAERLMITDNVLRRQLNPMEQARLIKRLKQQYGIKQGSRIDLVTSVTVTEVTKVVGVGSETAKRLDRLNDLIPELQNLVSTGELGMSNGAELAVMTADQQQALVDAIGAHAVADLKRADIQAAKKAPDTSALEAQMAALEAERDELQSQLDQWTAQTATPSPDDESSSLIESLRLQLDAAEATRQEYADELARLKAQGPVERIVEKIVPDPDLHDRLQASETALNTLRQQYDQLVAQQQRSSSNTAESQGKSTVEEVTLVNRLEILRREIGMAERELGRKRTGLEFMQVGRNALQQLDKAQATLEALASGELDSLIPPEIVSWSYRLRHMADWLDHLVSQPASTRIVDIQAYPRD